MRGEDSIFEDQLREYGPDDVSDPGFDSAEYYDQLTTPDDDDD